MPSPCSIPNMSKSSPNRSPAGPKPMPLMPTCCSALLPSASRRAGPRPRPPITSCASALWPAMPCWMRQQARNQQHALSQWPVVVATVTDRFDAVVVALDAQLTTLHQEITAALKSGAWAASAALLLSIPGIGTQAAAWLLVTTVNFTLCDTPEAVVAYAGLNPLERESGTSVRGRPHIGRGGNARLRTVLYMAALSASRYSPSLHAFYTRLRERGKAGKVARCEVARKLIHLAWAVVKHGQLFDPQYRPAGQSAEVAQ